MSVAPASVAAAATASVIENNTKLFSSAELYRKVNERKKALTLEEAKGCAQAISVLEEALMNGQTYGVISNIQINEKQRRRLLELGYEVRRVRLENVAEPDAQIISAWAI